MQNAIETIKFDEVEYVRKDSLMTPIKNGETQIVVMPNGFIYVGEVVEDGDNFIIRNAKNLRKWGTTRGLGELRNGKLPNTVVDDCGEIIVSKSSVNHRMRVNGW